MANKILIIDDEPETLEVLETKFKAAGFEVALCDNGRDALAAAKAAKPQAVVMEALLPGIDGKTLSGILASDPDTGRLPLFILTSLEQSRSLFEGAPQVKGFLTKPFSFDELQGRVKDAIAEAANKQ